MSIFSSSRAAPDPDSSLTSWPRSPLAWAGSPRRLLCSLWRLLCSPAVSAGAGPASSLCSALACAVRLARHWWKPGSSDRWLWPWTPRHPRDSSRAQGTSHMGHYYIISATVDHTSPSTCIMRHPVVTNTSSERSENEVIS